MPDITFMIVFTNYKYQVFAEVFIILIKTHMP